MKMSKNFRFKSLPNVKEIIFHSVSTDMNFLSWDENVLEIDVELSGFKDEVEEYEPVVENHGNTVDVFFLKKKAFSISFFGTSFTSLKALKATVKVPKEIALNAKSTSGDIHMNKTSFKKMEITTISGDFNAKNVFCHEMKAKLTSGDVKVEGLSQAKRIEIRSISGDVFLRNVHFLEGFIHSTSGDVKMMEILPDIKNLNVKTISGDVHLYYALQPKLHVEFSTVSGDINVNGRTFKGKAKNIDFNIGKNPDSFLKFKSVSGDLKVNFKDDKEFNFDSSTDNDIKSTLRDIMKKKKATTEEIMELMETMGYSKEEIEEFLKESEEIQR
ncbi:DUF4097 family beta strand repeat-containing protein [Mesoaciditoga sp.]